MVAQKQALGYLIKGPWNDENVQVNTITTSNKVTSKCRVIVPTGIVKRNIYEINVKTLW